MDVSESSLWEEVKRLSADGAKPVHFRWGCEFILENETLSPTKLLQVRVGRQYTRRFTDEIYLTVMIPQGTYAHRLFPQRDTLLVSLFKEPVTEIDGAEDLSQDIQARTYRGVLLEKGSDLVEGEVTGVSDEETADLGGLQEYHIQLIDLASEQLRMRSVGGIYRDMTTSDVVQGTLSLASSDLGLDDQSSVQGVDVVPGNNDQVRDHIVVPHGTRATELVNYIQEHSGGIYSAGAGFYLQNGIWYVYPQYNLKRFTAEPRNLTVFNIPQRRLPGVERTYMSDDDRLIVLATGETRQTDESEIEQLTRGNGVRYLDANRVIGSWRAVDLNTATAKRSENVRELTLKSRKVGLNYAPMSQRRITANPYFETSEIAPRLGTVVQTVWENADPDLIYPGMPARYVYLEGDILNDVYGIVLAADHSIDLQGQGISSERYRCNVVVTLFLDIAAAPTVD
jgi:hypothetical protein